MQTLHEKYGTHSNVWTSVSAQLAAIVLLDGGHAKVDQLYLQIAFIVCHQQNVPWGHRVCWLDRKTATNKTQWVINHVYYKSFAFIRHIRGTRGRDRSAQFPSHASTSSHRKASALAFGNARTLRLEPDKPSSETRSISSNIRSYCSSAWTDLQQVRNSHESILRLHLSDAESF